jgi:hypothetical protein
MTQPYAYQRYVIGNMIRLLVEPYRDPLALSGTDQRAMGQHLVRIRVRWHGEHIQDTSMLQCICTLTASRLPNTKPVSGLALGHSRIVVIGVHEDRP